MVEYKSANHFFLEFVIFEKINFKKNCYFSILEAFYTYTFIIIVI